MQTMKHSYIPARQRYFSDGEHFTGPSLYSPFVVFSSGGHRYNITFDLQILQFARFRAYEWLSARIVHVQRTFRFVGVGGDRVLSCSLLTSGNGYT